MRSHQLFPLMVKLLLLLAVISKKNNNIAFAFTTRLEWQEELLQSAKMLEPTPLSQAVSTLQRDGVVRIDGASVDPTLCNQLKQKMLKELSSSSSNNDNDKLYIPGTRLRFSQAIDVAFGNSRHDLLLPLSNSKDWLEVQQVLQSALQQLLQPFLVEAAEQVLPRLHGSSSTSSGHDNKKDHVELVELAGLMSRPGSQHQCIHGDYRRFHDESSSSNTVNSQEEPWENTQKRMGKLPPRLVTFVALQDIPSTEHGSTVFITGTHTAEAHTKVYDGRGIDTNDETYAQDVVATRQSLLDLSSEGVAAASQFNCGDMLVYDASILHWGGPNKVPQNDRAILYFGVARPGAAAMLSGDEKESLVQMGFQIAPPMLVEDLAGLPIV